MDEKALFDAVLGYLNFSDGTANASFQGGLNNLFRLAADKGQAPAHQWVLNQLAEQLELRQGASAAFKDVAQASGVVHLVQDHLLGAYRTHHRDLLAHLSDSDLFQPFFLARMFEATLAQHGPWTETDRIVSGAVDMLNDFVGHRPVATLENDRKLQPYPHERVRPIPIYLRGVGVAVGPFSDLIERMLTVLKATEPEVLSEAFLDLDVLDELALDPRAYDHTHPASSRPGYHFGEWDPHLLDNQGRFRRLVLRPMILYALLDWLEDSKRNTRISRESLHWEAAVALGGTLVLASGVSGDRPESHSSETSLATLVPRIARVRDAFYRSASQKFLRRGAKSQLPFASVRQYLNRFISRQRALQVQQDHLAQLYARIGYPEESRRQAEAISTPSVRMRTEMQILLTRSRLHAQNQEPAQGAALLLKVRELLHRAIECGAIVDPWNILGFQGNYSIFRALQDSVMDPRVGQLLSLVHQIFELYAQLLKVAAALGETSVQKELEKGVRDLAEWWDRYATYEVSDVQRVCGRELAGSALFVARVLSLWRQSGAAAGDVAFWNKHSREFTTPQAYKLVVEALFERGDLLTTRALLMHWLSQSDSVPLEEAGASFFELMLQWMNRCAAQAADTSAESPSAGQDPETLVAKLFDYLEVNAGVYWRAPTLGDEKLTDAVTSASDSEDADNLFSAAYEGVTYQDSAEDGQEGGLLEQGPTTDDSLSEQADQLKQRLAFLHMRAKLEQIAASMEWTDAERHRQLCMQWIEHATATKQQLLRLLDSINAHRVPGPIGSQDSIIEFDRLQSTKYDLLSTAINTTVETAHAVRYLCGAIGDDVVPDTQLPWEASAVKLHRALRRRDPKLVRKILVQFLNRLGKAPLLYVPLDKGGKPRTLFESRYVRDVMKQVAQELPRLGMFRETYRLLLKNQQIERKQAGVTEFNLLFSVGYTSVIENIVMELDHWVGEDDDETAAAYISPVIEHFSQLWIEHSGGVQYGELDRVYDEKSWKKTIQFIKTYGRGIFTQSFMTLGNLRGILRQGVAEFVDRLIDEADPYDPLPLVEDILEGRLDKDEAIGQFIFILRVIIENYEIYLDYNNTTTQSDYGENLHLLLELLRVLHSYERHRWGLEPAYTAHSILARAGRLGVAGFLEQAFIEETEEMAESFATRLKKAEKKCGIYLASVEDRVSEQFVRPLRLNRLLALLRPSIEGAGQESPPEAFHALRTQVEEFVQSAPGAGIDLPEWLEQVEDEVDRLLSDGNEVESTAIVTGPRLRLSLAEFQEQLDEWDDPLESSN